MLLNNDQYHNSLYFHKNCTSIAFKKKSVFHVPQNQVLLILQVFGCNFAFFLIYSEVGDNECRKPC